MASIRPRRSEAFWLTLAREAGLVVGFVTAVLLHAPGIAGTIAFLHVAQLMFLHGGFQSIRAKGWGVNIEATTMQASTPTPDGPTEAVCRSGPPTDRVT